MFSVEVKRSFRAHHGLYNYKGEDEALHLEEWILKIEASANKLDEAGCCIDFHEVDNVVDKLIKPIEEKSFNELQYFKTVSPSAENIAQYFFYELNKKLSDERVTITKVTACEDENHCASFQESKRN